jgi:hypothetical protein
VWFFGRSGSGDEIDVALRSGYTGPGTYSAPSANASITVAHGGNVWYAQLSSDPGAYFVINAGGSSGRFSFPSQAGVKETLTGNFACR